MEEVLKLFKDNKGQQLNIGDEVTFYVRWRGRIAELHQSHAVIDFYDYEDNPAQLFVAYSDTEKDND